MSESSRYRRIHRGLHEKVTCPKLHNRICHRQSNSRVCALNHARRVWPLSPSPRVTEKKDPGSGKGTPSGLLREHAIHGLFFLLLFFISLSLSASGPYKSLLCNLQFLILATRGKNMRNHTLNCPSFS